VFSWPESPKNFARLSRLKDSDADPAKIIEGVDVIAYVSVAQRLTSPGARHVFVEFEFVAPLQKSTGTGQNRSWFFTGDRGLVFC
jgi:hypothetical protein